MRRLFWIGLIVPAVACAVAALLIGPDSWVGWVAVVAVAPAAAAGVAVTITLRDRAAARR
jgi:1,4-dihydroxy-2-naphthoate octaprenyltransferase